MQNTAIIILALLSLIGPGALIVAYIAWRRRRQSEDAQIEREATARAWGETAADDPQQVNRPIWRPD